MGGSAGEQHRVQAGGILRRLARDRRGNTLAMMAIALVPLVGMAGSAIDTARVYYVKVRLQQACDAGVLAGRKFMDGTDFNANAQQQAQAFFANNFKAGMMGSTVPTFVPLKTTENQVAATATTVVPMTLMRMAGFAPVTISVACEAKLEIPNLDIMFVLDTTGSMTTINNGDSVSRIAALRTAVVNFFDTVEAAKRPGTQVRYGAVPYANNVNVGMLLRPEWMADSWTYQSRKPNEKVVVPTSSKDTREWIWDTWSGWRQESGNKGTRKFNGSPENCVAPGNTYKETWLSNRPQQDDPDGRKSQYSTYRLTGSKYWASLSNGVCTITEEFYDNYVANRTDYQKRNPKYNETTTGSRTDYYWDYLPITYPVDGLKGNGATMAGGKITAPVGNNHQDRVIQWNANNACIEERKTVKQMTYAPIPAAAYDLDVDMVPTSDPDTRWGPWIPNLVYARKEIGNWTTNPVIRTTANYDNIGDYNKNGNVLASCPSPATKLRTMNRGNIVSMVNTLRVGGTTHHDIGFLWGLRLISPTGLFADENASGPSGSQISRHIIFMTDGQTDTQRQNYEAYGLSVLDQRRTNGMPTDNDQNMIVANRLSALCDVARRKNVTVWVIAFGTTLSPMLSGCASNGRAFEASNSAQLNTAFSNIAAQIAKLRVSR